MRNKDLIYIAIVDDKKMLRHTLEQKLTADGCRVLFTAENGTDFLDKMTEARKTIEPEVILMDIDMPVMDGIEAVEKGKERYPNSKYLMLTIFDDEEKIFNAIKAGASGYLLKDEPIEKIKEAITNLLKDEGAPMSPSIARKALNLLMQAQPSLPPKDHSITDEYNLTDREKEVLVFLTEGLEYKEMAANMNVSPNTIRNHIASIYRKLHVTSKVQAVRVFLNKK